MKKSDLKTGMQVELRNGSRYVVMLGTISGDVLVRVNGIMWGDISKYGDDITHCTCDSLDVIGIYENAHPDQYLTKEMRDNYLIWVRPRQLPEYTM